MGNTIPHTRLQGLSLLPRSSIKQASPLFLPPPRPCPPCLLCSPPNHSCCLVTPLVVTKKQDGSYIPRRPLSRG